MWYELYYWYIYGDRNVDDSPTASDIALRKAVSDWYVKDLPHFESEVI